MDYIAWKMKDEYKWFGDVRYPFGCIAVSADHVAFTDNTDNGVDYSGAEAFEYLEETNPMVIVEIRKAQACIVENRYSTRLYRFKKEFEESVMNVLESEFDFDESHDIKITYQDKTFSIPMCADSFNRVITMLDEEYADSIQ